LNGVAANWDSCQSDSVFVALPISITHCVDHDMTKFLSRTEKKRTYEWDHTLHDLRIVFQEAQPESI